LEDLRFWSYVPKRDPKRSPTLPVAAITNDLIKVGNFLFLGHLVRRDAIDTNAVIFLFDRLLDLYEYVEGTTPLMRRPARLRRGFEFKAGCSLKPGETLANWRGGRKKVNLAHNNLQQALFDILSAEYGAESVGTENDSGRGSRVDLVVRTEGEHSYYEIKTGPCIRSCLREALAQLIEYSYWPGGREAERMVVVSENVLTPDAHRYIKALRSRFKLPIFYQHLDLKSGILGPFQ
jgi:hypothetical protein